MNVWDLHSAACEASESFYTDPDTGLSVFTEFGLKQRKSCCGSGCRHCPFSHESIPTKDRFKKIQQASWLTEKTSTDSPTDILFWSGGKDSYLTLRALQRERTHNIVLLTTFDASQRLVAHQEIAIADVVRQAKHLDLPLLGVPLHSSRDYLDSLAPALHRISNVNRLVFGDLHLEHIRSWREKMFSNLSKGLEAPLAFPLWHANYSELMDDLEASGVPCAISAVTKDVKDSARVGDLFTRSLVNRLANGVDHMGENGEFHTLAKVWEAPPA